MSILHDTDILVLAIAVLGAGLSLSALRTDKPAFKIAARWLLWFCGATGLGALLIKLDLSGKSLLVTTLFCFLLWPLLETLYNWLAIDALSRSGNPLFPKYRPGENEWPIDKTSIQIREYLRSKQYRALTSAIGTIGDDDCVRCAIFESPDHVSRVGVCFVVGPAGPLPPFFSISTILEDGRRIVTDNDSMPFGGFYPEHVFVERHPLSRSLPKLMKRHAKRLEKAGNKPVEWSGDPVAELNKDQQELEQLNTSLGFLVEPSRREELGNISSEGRYRIWKEIWMLSYLGRPFSY
jgi:hypothetical protein